MAYKCLVCGHIFEEGEQAIWSEGRGEYWGQHCSEEMSGCPLCKGDYEETVRCNVCKSEHLEDELNGGVCNECIDKYRKDFKACYDALWNEKDNVKINILFTRLFTAEDIEEILMEYIQEKCKDIDCSPLIDEDISWFGEKIIEEVSK